MRVLLLLLLVGLTSGAFAQTFINFDGYLGTGISTPDPNGEAIINGMLNGAVFTTTAVGDDLGRGSSADGVSTGGIYAFEVKLGDMALGVQPAGSDFTPGSITLELTNNSGGDVTAGDDVVVSYTIYTYNDQDRSNSWNFAYSTDGSNFIDVPSVDFATPAAADANAAWVPTQRTLTINGLNLPVGGRLFIRFLTDDVSGSGSRDQIAVDDIDVSFFSILPVSLTEFVGSAPDKTSVRLNWATAQEQNNAYFDLEWSADGRAFEPIARLTGMNYAEGADYDYLDRRGLAGANYYRLRQVDFDGTSELFGPVMVELESTELSVFPNPARDMINVRGTDAGAKATVLDVNGRVLAQRTLNDGTIDVAELRAGTYLLRVETATGVEVLRFVRR